MPQSDSTHADRGQSRDRLDELLPELYRELRRLASQRLRKEAAGHTLQTTALAHEAYLRLARQHDVEWADRTKVLAAASEFMRRILVDHARKRNAHKRKGNRLTVSWSEMGDQFDRQVDLVELDDALHKLGEISDRYVRTVVLRFFGGLSIEETAAAMESSIATVNRDWRFAKAWLYRQLA